MFLRFFCCFCVDRSDSESTYCGRLFTHRCATLLIQRTHILPYRVLLVRCGGNTTNRDGINKEKEGKTTHTCKHSTRIKKTKVLCVSFETGFSFVCCLVASLHLVVYMCVCVSHSRGLHVYGRVCVGGY